MKAVTLNKLLKLLLGFVAALVLFNCAPAEAATVRINPTKIRLVIAPGESKSGVIQVENPSEEPLVVKAYLQDWRYTNQCDGTKEFSPAGTTPLSAAGWISISLSDFVIPANGRQNVNYTVKVPDGADGGHYAVLFFESLLGKPDLNDTAQLGVMVRIGALFYIEPKATIKRLAEIKDFSIKKDQDKNLAINLNLVNSGNVDITSKATFHIIDEQGNVLARGDFNDSYTLPGNTAKLSALWKDGLPKGGFDLVLTFDLGKALDEKEFGRGPVITREAHIEIGTDGEVKSGELK
jgi:hypothetical protein